MSRLLIGLGMALDPPLRFLLGSLCALAAAWLGVIQARPEAGFPWPGRIVYVSPGIECLLLGFLLVICLGASGLAPRLKQTPDGAVTMACLGLGGAGLVQGLAPAGGLGRMAALVFVGWSCLRWSRWKERGEVARSFAFLVVCLVLVRFVLPRALAQTLAGLPTGGFWVAGLSLAFGAAGEQVPPPGDEYRIFLVILLFGAALAARLEAEVPAPLAPSLPPADRTLPAAGPEAAALGPATETPALPPGQA